MNYIYSNEKPYPGELAQMYADPKWHRPIGKINYEKTINNTSVWFLVRKNNELVAMARLMTDGFLYGCIYDLIVKESHQKNGVAKEIMNRVVLYSNQEGIKMLHLWPAKGLIDYYKKLGFSPLNPDQPTMVLKNG